VNITQAQQLKQAVETANELRRRVAALEAAYTALIEQLATRKPGRPKKHETH